MEDKNLIKELNGKKFKEVKFVSSDPNDKACNHCAFELGKCRGAIWVLGQCYVVEGEEVTKDIYYEEVKDEDNKDTEEKID